MESGDDSPADDDWSPHPHPNPVVPEDIQECTFEDGVLSAIAAGSGVGFGKAAFADCVGQDCTELVVRMSVLFPEFVHLCSTCRGS